MIYLGVAILMVILLHGSVRAEPPYDQAGNKQVSFFYEELFDEARHRPIPVKIYHPQGNGPCPVIIFSHGLGGSKDSYEYLGRRWASRGFISIHPQHQGSDQEIWKDKANPIIELNRAVKDPTNLINRPLDVKFIINQLIALNQKSPLKGQVDQTKIGVGGHSFGAYTTLALVGQILPKLNGQDFSFLDPRIKAAVVMSPPTGSTKAHPKKSYGSIHLPILHLTGTKDNSPIDPKTLAQDRRLPYDNIQGPDQFLVILEGADHMVFAGQRLHKTVDTDPLHHNLILQLSSAFWEAYLNNDPTAKAWLIDGGLQKSVNQNGRVEIKR
ncbi:MAG: acetylhydrolase [Syntrophales bacterium LBB04]|nr:acetylhydrolase [Syntrophales bacterium LBB04]